MSLKQIFFKFSQTLIKKNISEPYNSLMFILLKVHGYDLKHFKYFKKIIFPKLLNRRMKRITYIQFLQFFVKRLNHYPIQYIIGKWYFRNILVECKPPVLIPRIETEQIVDLALKNVFNLIQKNKILQKKKIYSEVISNCNHKQTITKDVISEEGSNVKFLEIGLGTGAISISILKELANKYSPNNTTKDKEIIPRLKSLDCVGIDIDSNCIQLSRRNANMIMKSNSNTNSLLDDRIKFSFKHCDFNQFPEPSDKFDFIISNPPYIKSSADNVMKDVSKHESHLALFSGEHGLDLITSIIKRTKSLVKKGGFVILEIDPEQVSKLIDILIAHGYKQFYFEKDIYGRDRFLLYYL